VDVPRCLLSRKNYNKGGTWSGASEAIKKEYCPVLCRENNRYQGNTGLIRMGAIPVTEDWDGEVSNIKVNQPESFEQLSLFG